jgi:outer membrane protein assembly factor BamA
VLGSLDYYSLLGDYRHYIMPFKPYTLAFRLLHYGRYGKDAEDQRLYPIFIGYQSLVRGYDSSSFTASDCGPNESGDCFDYTQLLGSRALVANLELRFPLFGAFGIGRGYYGTLPIELATFYDVGVAWQKGMTPQLFGGDRKAVKSLGLAMRINLMGYAVVEVDYVKPIDRPNKGWLWQFGFTPGF